MAGSFLLKGVLTGLLFGIPAGAVGTMAAQRAFSYGFGAGLKTGLGSSVADCFYAICGAFGITFVSDFLLKCQTVINILGGSLILAMGMRLISGRKEQAVLEEPMGGIKMFLSSFAVGITNPAAILTFLFAFSYFGITGKTGLADGIQLVAGVFIGTCIWWCLLSAVVVFAKEKTGNHRLRHMDRVFGVVLAVFGVTVFIRTFL
ncbi:MAG: LysE family transporter [Blautia sp.]|nr:LysE family transporter [Blautia sp.]MCM1201271.1 LysE family transporter [Bacteroides fragilis]